MAAYYELCRSSEAEYGDHFVILRRASAEEVEHDRPKGKKQSLDDV